MSRHACTLSDPTKPWHMIASAPALNVSSQIFSFVASMSATLKSHITLNPNLFFSLFIISRPSASASGYPILIVSMYSLIESQISIDLLSLITSRAKIKLFFMFMLSSFGIFILK